MPPALPELPARLTGRLYRFPRVHETYPVAPTLVDGRPELDSWLPTVVRAVGGYYQIIVNGTDYTFFRDLPTLVMQIDEETPFGWTRASIYFPQITAWEALGVGDLADFIDTENEEERVNVEIYWIDNANVQHEAFTGLAVGFEWDDGGRLALTCTGSGHQVGFYVRAPGISNVAVDLGHAIAIQYLHVNRPHLRTQEMDEVTTGILTRYRGAWETVTEYIKKLLTIAFDTDTNRQWTVMMDDERLPVLKLRADVAGAADYTVTYGARGVKVALQREWGNAPNVIYGEGEFAGITWRNMYFGEPVLFQPIAFDPEMHKYIEDADGTLVDSGVTPNLNRIRVESHPDLGAGFQKVEAEWILENIRLRDQDPGYVGKVTLDHVSPEECHAFQMRADRVLAIKHLFGTTMKFYIARCSVDAESGSVTLSVDTKARDIDLLDAIKARKEINAKNPIASLQIGRESGLTLDSKVPWDLTRSGWLPDNDDDGHRWKTPTARFAVAGHTWLVQAIHTAERQDIFRIECHWDENVAFHLSVYDQDPTAELPADPMAATSDPPDPVGPWTPPLPAGYLIGWGELGQRAGYYPFFETGPDGGPSASAPTGDFVEEGGFELNHDAAEADAVSNPQIHYVALWVDAAGGPYHGWLRMSPGRVVE